MTSARRKSFLSIIIFSIIFIFGVTAGMSFAYFSDTATATNTLSFGKLKIALSDDQTSATKTIKLTPNASGGNNLLAVNDTITLTGSIGLEDNSVPAYIRMKIELYELTSNNTTGNKVSASGFTSGFLTQMGAIKDGSKQWFVVGNYLYLGNKLEAGTTNDFTYSTSNVNATSNATNANKVTITDEMLTADLRGKSFEVKLVYQAIQASGALTTALNNSNYIETNATAIAGSALWGSIFGYDLDPMYETYNASYVRGNLNKTVGTHNSYSAYTSSLTTATGAKSPFEFFQEDTTGEYVAFGYFPQTIATNTTDIDTTTAVTFNGQQYYKDSSGYLYKKKTGITIRGISYDIHSFSGSGLISVTAATTTETYSFSNSSSAVTTSTGDYYFKIEPIIWKILNKSAIDNGSETEALLHSVTVLTTRNSDNESSVYKNSIQSTYLTGDFYDQSFSTEGKAKIVSTALNTDAYLEASNAASASNNKTTCNTESTGDKYSVFSLSLVDVQTYYTDNAGRLKFPTDYAIANNAETKSADYFNQVYGGTYTLRSFRTSQTSLWIVGTFGYFMMPDDGDDCGIVPALYLQLS